MSQDWRRRLLRKLKRWAEDRFPLTYPVRVYLRPPTRMGGHLGYFDFDDEAERGVIALSETLDHSALIETFLEEYAHARTTYLVDTNDNDEDPHHHPSFWAEYGRLVKSAREIEW
jgi:hypothetical protein